MLTAENYRPYARGQRVLIQLARNMCMATEDPRGSITVMQAPMEPLEGHLALLQKAFNEEHERDPSNEELQQLLQLHPPPMRPAMAPVIVGTLEVQGELLVVHYEVDEGTRTVKVAATVRPEDIVHVSALETNLIHT